MTSVRASNEYGNVSAGGASEWPKPRWSGARTWNRSASSGISRRNMRELVGEAVQEHDGRGVAGARLPVEDAVAVHGGVPVTDLHHD